jgi:N utilization substance protein B
MVGARRAARRLALDVLYEAEIKDVLPVEAYAESAPRGGIRSSEDEGEAGAPVADEVLEYSLSLVEGVQEHQADIDSLIVSHADRWAITRMPVIDRNLLRIGLFELLWGEGVPVAVVINEAVELAKALSTDDSGRFINGLLGRIVEEERIDG